MLDDYLEHHSKGTLIFRHSDLWIDLLFLLHRCPKTNTSKSKIGQNATFNDGFRSHFSCDEHHLNDNRFFFLHKEVEV